MMDISDTELKKRLEAYNVDVPPITYTTRDLLIKKLSKLDSSEQTSRKIQSNKSVDRNGRPILQSTPSVTFSPNDEKIDGYGYDYPEEQQSEEYFSKIQQFQEPVETSKYQDLIAEKTRYRKSKSPEARFRNNVSTPKVYKTSNYIEDENYPREIYTSERSAPSSTTTYCKVSPSSGQKFEIRTENVKDKKSSSCFNVIFKIIICLIIAFFLVVLYEYLTKENKSQLLS